MSSDTAGEGVRLQKYLAGAGIASRRDSEEYITAGRVRVNGVVVRELGTRVIPGTDRVEVDRRLVEAAPLRWVMYHKPPALLTTRSDPEGRPTIYERLPRELHSLHYVGRLDWGTEGLLLLTNDGDLANALLHPSQGVEREYRVWVDGTPSSQAQRRLVLGVELDDGPARAEKVRLVRTEKEHSRSLLKLVLREGRKREVRRLMEAIGHKVLYLKRVRFGPLELGKLQRGHWRELEEAEVKALRREVSGRKDERGGSGRGGERRGGPRERPGKGSARRIR